MGHGKGPAEAEDSDDDVEDLGDAAFEENDEGGDDDEYQAVSDAETEEEEEAAVRRVPCARSESTPPETSSPLAPTRVEPLARRRARIPHSL